MIFPSVLIIGPGLIGGSLALALKKHCLARTILGYSASAETLNQAKVLSIIDIAFTDLAEATKQADLVMICSHLGSYKEIASVITPHLKPETVLSDVGSVKSSVIKDMVAALTSDQQARFVPGHPIAGSEKSGPGAATAELFLRKKTILTPLPFTNPQAMQKVSTLWEGVGATVATLDAGEHDRIYAYVSHQVQLLAYAYMLYLEGNPVPITAEMHPFIRLGGSSPAMWVDIFLASREAILETVDRFCAHLKQRANEPLSLPGLIGSTLKDNLPPAYANYTGSGFRDFTSLANSAGKGDVNAFISQVEHLALFIKNDSSKELMQTLKDARHYYQQYCHPRA